MKVQDGYPEAEKMIANERKTLEFIVNHPICQTHYHELCSAARSAFDATRSAGVTGLTFEGTWDVLWQDRWLRLYAGGTIVANTQRAYDQVSYYLAVCDARNSNVDRLRLVRKFHFDFDPQRSESPTFHLQYGGEATPALKSAGVHDKYLFPWFESPRIPSFPMSLAILLHLGLTEFRDQHSRRLVEDNAWRNLVKQNEEFILKSFHGVCNRHFRDSAKGRKLLMDLLYE